MPKVMYIHSNDVQGQRFSGIDWHEALKSRGWESTIAVGYGKKSELGFVTNLFKFKYISQIHNLFTILERKTGHQSRLAFWTSFLSRSKHFKSSDVIHYQVLHDGGWFRIEALRSLSSKASSIWTLHDAWTVTGHCIQPLDCDQFKQACNKCPHLDWPMPVHVDKSKLERIRKQKVLEDFNGTIHVSTRWMERLIRDSGVSSDVRIEVIPFGIDQEIFKPGDQFESRKKTGIPDQDFVIGCRSTAWEPKNFKKFYAAIEILAKLGIPLTILTVNELDLFLPLVQKYSNLSVKDFGWLGTEDLVHFYRTIDLFAAVSSGESFGFMPLEAAACGAAVICLENGAIAELVEPVTPELCVKNSACAIAEVIAKLASDNQELKSCKDKLLTRVREEYSLVTFIERLTKLYDVENSRGLRNRT
jgi:glycosyltransferase involved in cell wall biosynthesis